MSAAVLPAEPEQTVKVCHECERAGACLALADLRALVLSRPLLEAEYGWDAFSFIAEARRQLLRAGEQACPQLAAVIGEAEELTPEAG